MDAAVALKQGAVDGGNRGGGRVSGERNSGTAFDWPDPLRLDGQLTEDERLVRDAARDYAQGQLMPRVLSAFREERFDREILDELGALGFLGATLPERYGGADAGYVSYG